ncbi:MAG: hypothetical protein VKL39_19675, partial [Leptolyngbyaceae bacterium]|nr:hypothetical protein [Leptolyngbyaceae bacterium]
HFLRSADVPNEKLLRSIREHFLRNLTQNAMANYMLKVIGADSSAKILFLDESLPNFPDYLSLFTLSGLKGVFGNRLSVPFEVPYIYEDWDGEAARLYGRGFSYVRKIPARYRSRLVTRHNQITTEMLDYHDFIVVGSVERNAHYLPLLKKNLPNKNVLINGEDRPNTNLTSSLKEISSYVFVRELP